MPRARAITLPSALSGLEMATFSDSGHIGGDHLLDQARDRRVKRRKIGFSARHYLVMDTYLYCRNSYDQVLIPSAIKRSKCPRSASSRKIA